MDSKTIRDKALKGLSAKNDQGEIEPVYHWDLDEEEKKEVMECIFNNPELTKEYYANVDHMWLIEDFSAGGAHPILTENNKENYDLWLFACGYAVCIKGAPKHFLDANFVISVLEECYGDGAYGDEMEAIMIALGDTNLCSDIHFIKKLISIHKGRGSLSPAFLSEKDTDSPVPFWLFNYCSPELLKDKTFLQEFISILSDEISSDPLCYDVDYGNWGYHWTVAINPDPRYFKAKIILSGLCKDPDIQNV